MAMSSFRRSLKAETKQVGGRGSKGSWRERMRLPQTAPTPFILIDAQYLDPSPPTEVQEVDPATGRPKPVYHAFHKARKHKRKLIKNGSDWFADEFCSAGHDPHNPQPCTGCYAMDQGDKSVTVADQFYFGLVHLVPYHSFPALDQQGKIMERRDGKGHLTNVEECAGRSCNYCRTIAGAPLTPNQNWPGWQPQHIGTTFGHRRYLEMGKGHLSNIESWDSTVGSTCCNCRSQLVTDGFKCPHCNNRIIDMAMDPRTDEQINEAVAKPYPCGYCNRPVLLDEETSCDRCTAQGIVGGKFPLFGTVLHALREGEGTKSTMVLRRFESVAEFEQMAMTQQLLFGATVAQILQGKTISQVIQELSVPYDFPKLNEPKSLGDQAKRLELAVPPSGQQQQVYAPQGYQGQQQQQGQQQNQQAPQGQQQGFVQYSGQQAPQQGQWQGNPQQQQQNFQPQFQQPPGQQQGFVPQQPQQQGFQPQFQPQFQQGGQQGGPVNYPQPGEPGYQGQPQQPQQGQQPGPQVFIPPGRQHFGS